MHRQMGLFLQTGATMIPTPYFIPIAPAVLFLGRLAKTTAADFQQLDGTATRTPHPSQAVRAMFLHLFSVTTYHDLSMGKHSGMAEYIAGMSGARLWLIGTSLAHSTRNKSPTQSRTLSLASISSLRYGKRESLSTMISVNSIHISQPQALRVLL